MKRVDYIDLISEVTRPMPPLPIAELPPPPDLARLRLPLRQARVMLISSAGVHERQDAPFAHTNDLTFRKLSQNLDPKAIRPSHPSPIRRPGLLDINVVYPYRRLAELQTAGDIGGPTPYHLSMQGAIKQLKALVTEMAPAMVESARDAGADAVLLVPL